MQFEQNPFSLYDFLGYFIPGAFVLYLSYFIHIYNAQQSLMELLQQASITKWEIYLPFIIASYITGQLLSFLSSYTIEKFCIWRYSYPYRFLMNFYHPGYFNPKKFGWKILMKRFLLGFMILPISVLDYIIGNIFKLKYLNNRLFSSQTIEMIKFKLDKLYKEKTGTNNKIDMESYDIFFLIYHYTQEKNINHSSKFQNYVALYGFARCISFSFLLIFWFLLLDIIRNAEWNLGYCISLFMAGIVSYLFFLSFCKFYRRYSFEVIMAFIAIE